jgi:branched-chain amino acid aminotransferase
MIGLTLPLSIQELRDIAIQTTRSSQLNSSLLRLYVSRGPGSFSPNPYESIGAQTYLVVTALSTPSEGQYENGVTAATSSIAVKEGFFATVKSCNYLPNVLMKKESVDRKLGFTVSVDERGFLAEGATENFAIVSHDNEFLVPNFNRTLRGITVTRLMELVHENLNQADCPITSVRHASITVEDVVRAREAMVIGTTLDCLPITRFNDQPIGINGKVGPAARWFRELLKRDFAHGVSV